MLSQICITAKILLFICQLLLSMSLIAGTFCVACTFPFLFNQCITCSAAADWAKFIYYVPFVVIFQFGWASTQVSHLSLIPHLASDEHDRVELNAIR
jgi:Na+/melibiose symporter-like transporter